MINTIHSINGPVVTIKNTKDFFMLEMVRVGHKKLVGEVISVNDSATTVQVYESTTSLCVGEPVEGAGYPMSVILGPGMLSNIYDGIQRPLKSIEDVSGTFIDVGITIPPIPTDKEWDVTVLAKAGDKLSQGQIYATCPETAAVVHKMLVPPGLSGEVTYAAASGNHLVDDVIVKLKDKDDNEHQLTLCQRWPIRQQRPFLAREPMSKPLVTGQRVIDSVFPIAKGGTAAIPGGFGTGKTITQHQLAKWSDADIIVYIGCGERGNEMTDVLTEFADLVDPRSGNPLMQRTVLIANTSNMPVAAREASIYTGVTMAEYYRDMGYHVAVMADSTSRWAEALREISGRLEEMPAEEGFPAYLPSRISQFYERAGYMKTFSGLDGSVSLIGAVSPQGADFSEPVTQNTKRFVRCFWALDKSLAYARHYPSINWTTSYSEYIEDLTPWYRSTINSEFMSKRQAMMALFIEEAKLMEIVKLIGADVLPEDQKLVLEVAKIFRVGFLQQNAYHKEDTYVPLEKQYRMMDAILYFYNKAKAMTSSGIPVSSITLTGIADKLTRMKYDIPNDQPELFPAYLKDIDAALASVK